MPGSIVRGQKDQTLLLKRGALGQQAKFQGNPTLLPLWRSSKEFYQDKEKNSKTWDILFQRTLLFMKQNKTTTELTVS